MIGIHSVKGSFSDRWIAYCKAHSIAYKLVDCYGSDIINQLADCDALMWHFNHKGAKESKFAKQLLYAVESSGKKIFPDFRTVWHFDDKVGQKYLLEAYKAPLAPSVVFYDKKEAFNWAEETEFPKVFKLRNGAGSANVKLVKSKKQAKRLIKKAFGRGFKQYEGWSNLQERIRKYRIGKAKAWDVIKGIIRLLYTTEYARLNGNEMGYVYFQDFVPENEYDIRVVVVGDKAYAIKRLVRENDFRASGSGYILYEKENFDEETIRMAFDISNRLKIQCMAYDFIYQDGKPLIVEISYGFSKEGYDPCTGYWDQAMKWYEGQFDPYGWMVEDLMMGIVK